MLKSPLHHQNSDRSKGKTMVIDKGLGLFAFKDLIETAGAYIDFIKLGFGTSVLYDTHLLKSKIQYAKTFGIHILPGGTLMESAFGKQQIHEFLDWVTRLGFTAVEISEGTIDLPRRDREMLIRICVARQLFVFTEIGKKQLYAKMDLPSFLEQYHHDIEHGADMVICEARESGKAIGIFDEEGNCHPTFLENFQKEIPLPSKLLWEAPIHHQQVQLIQFWGSSVHLGNIAPHDVLSLECLRQGLRADTFGLQSHAPRWNNSCESM